MALLEVENLKKYFPIKKGILSRTVGEIRAVDGISFTIKRGETLGLVGESGCGKTTVGRTILRLIEPTAGRVNFNGENLLELDGEELRNLRASVCIRNRSAATLMSFQGDSASASVLHAPWP